MSEINVFEDVVDKMIDYKMQHFISSSPKVSSECVWDNALILGLMDLKNRINAYQQQVKQIHA